MVKLGADSEFHFWGACHPCSAIGIPETAVQPYIAKGCQMLRCATFWVSGCLDGQPVCVGERKSSTAIQNKPTGCPIYMYVYTREMCVHFRGNSSANSESQWITVDHSESVNHSAAFAIPHAHLLAAQATRTQ
eukprot:7530879-Pyramimonas_sp.AAC.1